MEIEKLEDSCGDCSIEDLDIDKDKQRSLIAKEYDPDSEHPTPEQLLVRQAVKYLTAKQRAVWEYYNYDKLTQDEIAEKLGVTQQAVTKHIQACEKRIAKYCRDNMGAYQLLKGELK